MKILNSIVKNCTKTIDLQITLNEAEKIYWAANLYLTCVRDGQNLAQERTIVKSLGRIIKEAEGTIKKAQTKKEKAKLKRVLPRGESSGEK